MPPLFSVVLNTVRKVQFIHVLIVNVAEGDTLKAAKIKRWYYRSIHNTRVMYAVVIPT